MVFGRLGPSSTVARTSAELTAIAASLDSTFPPLTGARDPISTARPWRAKSFVDIAGDDDILGRVGLTLVALVGLVLVVACTNLSNLVLARGTTRGRELAVRRALGASRWRLVREQSTESLLIVIGGALASYACFHALRVLMSADFTVVLPFGAPWTLEIRPALNRTAVYVAVGSLLTSLVVFGLEPAFRLTRTLDIRGVLAAGGGAGNPRTGRQQVLLRWQVAIATGFFVVATMFIRFTIEEARHDTGVYGCRRGCRRSMDGDRDADSFDSGGRLRLLPSCAQGGLRESKHRPSNRLKCVAAQSFTLPARGFSHGPGFAQRYAHGETALYGEPRAQSRDSTPFTSFPSFTSVVVPTVTVVLGKNNQRTPPPRTVPPISSLSPRLSRTTASP
jgi:hypothetical protein